jgi:predicted exporter
MKRRAPAILIWALLAGCAVLVVARARYSADLSAFLPRSPSASERLLVEQLRHGVASRLIIVAIAGADALERARLSRALAARLRADPEFLAVENGDRATMRRDEAFLFAHRYLLSDTVTPGRFTTAGLHAALARTVDLLASPAGLMAQSLLPADPTGEMLTLLGQLSRERPPRTIDGVWASRGGGRALLLARTRAAGSDTDGQERAVDAIRQAFAAARAAMPAARLELTGPGVFAVEARSSIKRQVTRLSIVSFALILTLLALVYRSLPALLLGLVPVVSGALAGIAAVALGLKVVQGVTLGFGVTLIGEAVDYSIYLFIQSRAARPGGGGADPGAWREGVWPTVRLGMLTSLCGFASLLPSSFPGLAQLGLYSFAGVLAAGLVTRFVLPAMLPPGFVIRDLAPLGEAAGRVLRRARGARFVLPLLALFALAVLYAHRHELWSRQLSALSPVPLRAQRLDAELRGDLGAPDVRDLVVVTAPSEQAALEGAERIGQALDPLVKAGVLAGFESPAEYLPSRTVQRARRASLPAPAVLRARLDRALVGLPLRPSSLAPFLRDVEAARSGPLITRRSLAGSSFASAVDSLLVRSAGGWQALLPLEAPVSGPSASRIDIAKVRRAVAAAARSRATVLDLKSEANQLYANYLAEAVRLSLAGLAAIVILLLLVLRSPVRVLRVVAPLALAVLVTAACLTLAGVHLTLLHIIGMLLIVAVGSNYALFFDRRERAPGSLTLASLLVANCATVLGFGVLAFSSLPVLGDLGSTVAPGAWLALVFGALLARRDPDQ